MATHPDFTCEEGTLRLASEVGPAAQATGSACLSRGADSALPIHTGSAEAPASPELALPLSLGIIQFTLLLGSYTHQAAF